MKTLLFIVGFLFNLLLCCFPFKQVDHALSQYERTNEIVEAEEPQFKKYPERKGIAYGEMLKNKARNLPEYK